jgi:hypothetical protein
MSILEEIVYKFFQLFLSAFEYFFLKILDRIIRDVDIGEMLQSSSYKENVNFCVISVCHLFNIGNDFRGHIGQVCGK